MKNKIITNNGYIKFENNIDRSKTLSIKEYLDEVKAYLSDIINNLKESDTWKTQLAIEINFICSKGSTIMKSMNAFKKIDDI